MSGLTFNPSNLTHMASIRRKNTSKYWFACFTGGDGVQRQRSTKETNRSTAQKFADKLEFAYRTKLTEAQARKIIRDIYEEIQGEDLVTSSIRDFFAKWLTTIKPTVAPGTFTRYDGIIQRFISFLGTKADKDVVFLHRRDIEAMRNKTHKELSPETANLELKVLRSALKHAVADGLRLDNPASSVPTVLETSEDDDVERRPFTQTEFETLLKFLEGEWRGMVLAGLYTGLRLGDVAGLKWAAFNETFSTVSVRPGKTDRKGRKKKRRYVIIPIEEPLITFFRVLKGETKSDSVFPNANELAQSSHGESRKLSNEFYLILVRAGLAEKRSKKNTGRGHSVQRQTNALSFHSLRHTLTSWLKRAGAPEAVVRDIVGHESELVSRNYTHIDEETKRRALASLPRYT